MIYNYFMQDNQNNQTEYSVYDPEPQKGSRTITIAIILLVVFVLILVLFLILIKKPALFGSFAQVNETSVTAVATEAPVSVPQSISVDNSYLFASPLKAAVSVERIRITVYVLDGQGMGIAGKEVTLGNSDSVLHFYPISPTTDSYGRATFDVTGDQAGLFTIEALVDGQKLTQKVTISFN